MAWFNRALDEDREAYLRQMRASEDCRAKELALRQRERDAVHGDTCPDCRAWREKQEASLRVYASNLFARKEERQRLATLPADRTTSAALRRRITLGR